MYKCFSLKTFHALTANNAGINDPYLVQISGLCVSSSLLHTQCSSSYIKTDGHCSRHCCRLEHKACTVTFITTHIAWVIVSGTKSKQKEREGKYLHFTSSLLTRKWKLKQTETSKQYFIKCDFSLPLRSRWELHSSDL